MSNNIGNASETAAIEPASVSPAADVNESSLAPVLVPDSVPAPVPAIPSSPAPTPAPESASASPPDPAPVPAPIAMPLGIPVTAGMLAGTAGAGGAADTTGTAGTGAGTPLQNGAADPPGGATGLANTKEKTPMCLVNELARFNQVTHQYTLTDEQGPAHKKVFFVLLRLGAEEYHASGASIKKAQHAAATAALERTACKHPPLKAPRSSAGGGAGVRDNITPTMELNSLAMKLGEMTEYIAVEVLRPYFAPPNFNFRGMYNQRYHYPYEPRVFCVCLRVGEREFGGEGSTRQAARHSAATRALHVLRNLPPSPPPDGCAATPVADGQPQPDGGSDNELKSEISLVHEIALKRNYQVNFQVEHESGPPHMRHFELSCACGDLWTKGDGNSKKRAKKRAAQLMLAELRGLPALPPAPAAAAGATGGRPKKPPPKKKKQSNIIKLQKAEPTYGVGVNPISRLIQIQQAKRAREPAYSLMGETGMQKQRQFTMKVDVDDESALGVGPNKKLAKRSAAEAMLQQLGYSRLAPAPTKPALRGDAAAGTPNGDKKVTFMDQASDDAAAGCLAPASGRQMLPGVIVIPEGACPATKPMPNGGDYASPPGGGSLNRAPGAPVKGGGGGEPTKFTVQTIATVARELLEKGCSSTADAIANASGKRRADGSRLSPKQQLLYLAGVLDLNVQFTDLPKSCKKSEYMSLVSLSTCPPQVSHGSGLGVDAAHHMAAHTALRALADLYARAATTAAKVGGGAVTATPPPPPPPLDTVADAMGAGDGPHVQTIASSEKRASSEEPIKVEPIKVEPIKVEPIKVEPIKVEPIKVESIKVEPAAVETT